MSQLTNLNVATLASAARHADAQDVLWGDYLMNAGSKAATLDNLAQLRRAAIAIVLFGPAEDPHVIFTRRSAKLKAHAGQVSFPGGRREEDDQHLLQTALRECGEEISLELSTSHLLAQLPPSASGSGYLIQPYLFHVADLSLGSLRAQESEVDEIFSVRCRDFAGALTAEIGHFTIDGRPRYWYKYATEPSPLWGVSAAIWSQLLMAANVPHLASPDQTEASSLADIDIGLDDVKADRRRALEQTQGILG